MKRVEVYEAKDGSLHKDLERAFASEIHAMLPNSAVNPNAKVLDWSDCLRIVEQVEIIAPLLINYLEKRGQK
ncbi:hypothetical protein [Brucella sp. 2280]|uniref:hypothetical protein n=1 Tax=Brucella sp. 2280 TaxID=2592625 RepID=UPI001294A3F2|nr:hypothetical protein [Brucella sp. 2280]QGA56147.1 hypothetical protein GHC20_03190 [Brucella sp. 2280]QGA56477.1 hypothetical protein GHC20_04985 [Brucella sp. 2280]